MTLPAAKLVVEYSRDQSPSRSVTAMPVRGPPGSQGDSFLSRPRPSRACRPCIASRYLIRAQKRPAAVYALGDARLVRIVRRRGTARVARDLVRRQRRRRSPRDTSRSPTPTRSRRRRPVRSHSAETVRQARCPRTRRFPRRGREMAVMAVRHLSATRAELVTPGIEHAGQPAARGELPLGFRGQPLAGPFRVGGRILVGHVHDRKRAFRDRAARAERMTPVRSLRDTSTIAVRCRAAPRGQEARRRESRPRAGRAALPENPRRAACVRRR